MDDFSDFGYLLRWARRHGDMSQRQLARWSGVPKSTIADIETGRCRPRIRVVVELLGVLGLELGLVRQDGLPAGSIVVDPRRDRAGRQVPPHFDVRQRNRAELWSLMTGGACPDPAPLTWRRSRDHRDVLRQHGYFGDYPHPALPRRGGGDVLQPPAPLVDPLVWSPYMRELRTGLAAGFDDRLRWRGWVGSGQP